jgi:hypothetical protein
LKVRYDFEYSPSGRWNHKANRPSPDDIAWGNVVVAEFPQQVDIEAIARLGREASSLHTLMLSDSDADDSVMQIIARMQRLERLFLSNTQVTDEGLKCLWDTDSGSRLLKRLTLTGCPITDHGLNGIENLQQLESLLLVDTRIGDRAMEHIVKLSQLKILWLDGTLVTNDCIGHLLQLPQLGRLHLNRTAVTDAGAEELLGATTLRKLHLADTRVSDEMVTRLRTKLTNTMVWADSGYGV